MRSLNVGDIHAEARDLKAPAFTSFMWKLPEIARAHRCQVINLLGDLCHTHDALNSFVLNFYSHVFKTYGKVASELLINVLIGNHDQASTTEPYIHSLSSMTAPSNIQIHTYPTYSIPLEAVLMPYMHSNEEFVASAESLRKQYGAQNLICHQTFKGACYENKFMAEGGVDAALLGFKRIISGHIHMRQNFGVVHYTGTPRWKTASDFNEPKSLTVFDSETDTLELIDCAEFFNPWRRHVDRQGEVLPADTFMLTPETEIIVEGDAAYVEARVAEWAAKGVRTRSRIVGKKVAVSVNSGKAIGTLLSEYVDHAEMRNGSPKAAVKTTLGSYV